MDRRLFQLGFLLLLLAFLTGIAVPGLRVPRLALAAHIAGLLGGILLLVLGVVVPRLTLGPALANVHRASWVYATYANWLACLLGALTGASGLTPLAGAGHAGSALAERVVALLLVSLSLAALLAASLALWGLRRLRAAPASPPLA